MHISTIYISQIRLGALRNYESVLIFYVDKREPMIKDYIRSRGEWDKQETRSKNRRCGSQPHTSGFVANVFDGC